MIASGYAVLASANCFITGVTRGAPSFFALSADGRRPMTTRAPSEELGQIAVQIARGDQEALEAAVADEKIVGRARVQQRLRLDERSVVVGQHAAERDEGSLRREPKRHVALQRHGRAVRGEGDLELEER